MHNQEKRCRFRNTDQVKALFTLFGDQIIQNDRAAVEEGTDRLIKCNPVIALVTPGLFSIPLETNATTPDAAQRH